MSPQQNLESQNNNKQSVLQVTKSEMFSGPLPPPNVLEYYDKIVPGAGERIIKMAEDQAEHRRKLECNVINSDVCNSKLGLIFGLVVGIVALVSATLMVLFNHALTGSIVAILYISSLVGTFVYGSQRKRVNKQPQDNQDKE